MSIRTALVDRITTARPRVVLLIAWLIAIAYAFPGYLSTDSADQLFQSRAHHLDDWHPPAMAFVWSLCERLISGPLPMVVLQVGLLELGLYSLLCRRLRPGPAAIATAAIVLFPPVLTPMAVIWKDSQMAGFLAAGAALLAGSIAHVRARPSRSPRRA